MDLSQLSKETMELSEQIGSKQMQLLFDENYFCEDISLEEPKNNILEQGNKAKVLTATDSSEGPGVAFFIDKSTGSFCLRGSAFSSSEVLKDREVLEAQNHRFHRADEVYWFSCGSFSKAQVIVDQMMNRRFPFEDRSICNISDPGASWWYHKESDGLKIYFKSLGRRDEFKKIGPLGDSEIAKFRWEKASSFFSSFQDGISLISEDNCISIKTDKNSNSDIIVESFEKLFNFGENNFNEEDFSKKLEHKTLFLYLSELASIRKFWLMVEQILLTAKK